MREINIFDDQSYLDIAIVLKVMEGKGAVSRMSD